MLRSFKLHTFLIVLQLYLYPYFRLYKTQFSYLYIMGNNMPTLGCTYSLLLVSFECQLGSIYLTTPRGVGILTRLDPVNPDVFGHEVVRTNEMHSCLNLFAHSQFYLKQFFSVLVSCVEAAVAVWSLVCGCRHHLHRSLLHQ